MGIHQGAKLVFKGVIYEVYHWPQKMFDGSIETFECLKRPNTVEVIAAQGGKIVMARQLQPQMDKPCYTLFGGRQQENEEPLFAAKRELLEEAGLKSDDWELLKIYQPESKIDYSIYLFVARDCRKTAEQKLDAGEKIELELADQNRFISIVESDEFWGGPIQLDFFKMHYRDGTLDQFLIRLFK